MELLKKLCLTYSPSGNEEKICDLIIKEATPYADDIQKDALSNIVVHKKGNGKKLMLCAHMDEIGLAITYIDDDGFLRFGPVGGVDAIFSLYQSVEFENGTRGVISYEEDIDSIKNIKLSKMFIDIGAKDKKEAESKVNVGDFCSFSGEFLDMGNMISSKALDNRAGVYVLLRVLKELKKSDYDLYFVFTTQEEVGLRGAKVSSFNIEPDMAICVDVTDTGDTPSCKVMDVKLGMGCAIKVKDASVICDKEIRESLEKKANDNGIKFQREILSFGGTDAGAIHTSKYGVKTGAISIPVRYIHSTKETAHKDDIESAVKLIKAFCEK
ncbi:MAG: M42 family metallopeptidase [Ruminococcaceae bacterium]|nr:M42 family metallopeptidase [Oscillospiraceae bacterium]